MMTVWKELCPCCKDTVVSVGLHQTPEHGPSEYYDTEPCAECKTYHEQLKFKGFVVYVIEDEFERRTALGERLASWSYFHSVHVIDHGEARRIFGPVDPALGCAFISESLAKRVGIELNERI